MAQTGFGASTNKFSNASAPQSTLQRPPTGNSTMQRPQTGNSNQRAQTFEEAIRLVSQSINQQVPNAPSVLNFFNKFDAYKGRVYSDWELFVMFPGLDQSVFQLIHDTNSTKQAVKKGEINLSFLKDEIELTQNNLVRMELPPESAYLSMQASSACEQALVALSNHRTVQYNSSMAFDELFKKQSQIDYRMLDRALKDCNISCQVGDVNVLVAYFSMDRLATNFNKIHFVQGIIPWVEKKRPNSQMGGQQQQQQMMGQNMNPQNMQQMMMGQTMPPGQQYQQPFQINANPGQQFAQTNNLANQFVNQALLPQGQFNGMNGQQQPPMTPPMGQQPPQNMGQQYQPMGQQQPMNMGQQQQPAYGQASQTPQAMAADDKYTQTIMRFQIDLEIIHDGLMQRHTGVYKWFQTHSQNGTVLQPQEFNNAVLKINNGVRTSSDIYLALQQFVGMTNLVPISEVEGLFKAFGRRNKPKIIPDAVFDSILKAFNADDQFIQNGLYQKQPLVLDTFVQFFGQYPEHSKYFNLNDVTALGEIYSMNQDAVNLQTFMNDLIRRRRDTNMMKQAGFDGIQNARNNLIQATHGYSSMNPLMPNHSSDNTRAATEAGQRPPNGFIPHTDDNQIHEIIKACFVGGRLCFDHFSTFGNQGQLTMNDFVTAISGLGCSWPNTSSQQIFQAIDQQMNGQTIGHLSAKEIDRYIHFSCRKLVTQLQDELMTDVMTKSQQRQVNLQSEFSRTGRAGVAECSYQEFKQVLQQTGVSFSENDMSFISKKYAIGPNIQYQKFIDDISQVNRVTNQITVNTSAHDMPSIIAESVKKQCHIMKYDLTQLITNQIGMRPVNQMEFCDIFASKLHLVPQICNDSALIEVYQSLNGANMGQVATREIVRYMENKCPKSIPQLMSEVTRKLFGQNLNQSFQKHPDYQRSKQLLMSDFQQHLTGQLRVSQLDSQFISTCFQKGGDVDVQSFIQECNNSVQGDKAQALPIVKKIAQAADARYLQLNNLLGQYARGGKLSISSLDFTREILNIVSLQPIEQEQLERAYASREGQGQIDYVQFLEDARLQSSKVDHNAIALTKDQSDLIEGVKKMLVSNRLDIELCQNLKRQDYMDVGYMTTEQLKSAIDQTFAKLPAKSSGQPNSMSSKQVTTLCATMNMDSQGRYNWKMLLNQMFGHQEAQRLLDNSLSNAQTTSNHPFQPPYLSAAPQVTAENQFLAQIGKKIGTNQHRLVEEITKSAQSQISGVPQVKEYDVSNILAKLQVNLNVEERLELSKWCQQHQDSHQLVNSHRLMMAIGLQPPKAETKAAPKKVLQEQELRQCQDVMIMIRKELMGRGTRPEQVVAKYRTSVTDVSMAPKEFKYALSAEFRDVPTIRTKIDSNSTLSLLIHYLVREEPGRVSYAKLLAALALPDQDPPLRQDGIENLVQYQVKLVRQMSMTKIPLSIIELNAWMKKSSITLHTLLELQPNQVNTDMLLKQFEDQLKLNGYHPKELPELIKACQGPQTAANKISVELLNKHLKSLVKTDLKDPRTAHLKYGKLTPQTRSKIQQISEYMIRKRITIEEMHKNLDINNDGSVDKIEFVDGLTKFIMSTSLTKQDLGVIFDEIDLNGDHYLSVNEFGYYLEGAKLQKDQKKANLDQGTKNDIAREIDQLFSFFDTKGTGHCTAIDIQRSMQALGTKITMEQATEMVRSVDMDNDGNISRVEFQQLMMPILIDELVAGDDQVEDMRAKFREADTDYSGFLSVDEFYTCLLSMGTDVSRQEVVNMFTEFDVNQDMQIDIDEFIKFFSVGDQIEFQEEGNVNTYMKIKKARKLNILDFLKAFNTMPQSFSQSFFAERWIKTKRNMPSSVFKAQIDPKTMLWKDMMPVLTETLSVEQNKLENRPRLRPVPSSLGAQIMIEGAEGVPLPAQSAEFDRANIVKRVVRMGLYDTVKQELIFNSAQVVAEWTQSNEDVWTFNNSQTASLNPILFRTTASDDLNKNDVVIVFELVVYIKKALTETTEWTAGWAQAPLITCERDVAKIRLEIQGGTPMNTLAISKDDVQTKRTGMKALMKMFNSNIKSTIIVSFKPLTSVEAETRLHLEMLPSTCLIQKKLLFFVSGYRNYAAEQLLPQMSAGNLKQPVGNVVMSCFSKILDCPDLLETVSQIFTEDHFASLTLTQKKSTKLAMEKMENIVTRLYPIIFSDGFAYQTSQPTSSACGDAVKLALRKNLITHALRFNNPTAKVKVTQPPDALTHFKPFNIREIEYEVWDFAEQKQGGTTNYTDQSQHVNSGRQQQQMQQQMQYAR